MLDDVNRRKVGDAYVQAVNVQDSVAPVVRALIAAFEESMVAAGVDEATRGKVYEHMADLNA